MTPTKTPTPTQLPAPRAARIFVERGRTIHEYGLPDLLDLLTRTPATGPLAVTLRELCVAFVTPLLDLPQRGPLVPDLADFGRRALQAGLPRVPVRHADGALTSRSTAPTVRVTPHQRVKVSRIGFSWQWDHPRRPDVTVRVTVTDVLLCRLAGQPDNAWADASTAEFNSQQELDLRNDTFDTFDDHFDEAQYERDALRWAEQHPLR